MRSFQLKLLSYCVNIFEIGGHLEIDEMSK